MCRRVNCNKCNKPTFAGCGMHVEQVLAGVPVADRCNCRAQATPPAPSAGGAGDKAPWWKVW